MAFHTNSTLIYAARRKENPKQFTNSFPLGYANTLIIWLCETRKGKGKENENRIVIYSAPFKERIYGLKG